MRRGRSPAIPDRLLGQRLSGPAPRAALAEAGLPDGLENALADELAPISLDTHLSEARPER